MTRSKDIERSREVIFRSGERLLRRDVEEQERKRKSLEEEKRLKALGLVSTKGNKLFVARRAVPRVVGLKRS